SNMSCTSGLLNSLVNLRKSAHFLIGCTYTPFKAFVPASVAANKGLGNLLASVVLPSLGAPAVKIILLLKSFDTTVGFISVKFINKSLLLFYVFKCEEGNYPFQYLYV